MNYLFTAGMKLSLLIILALAVLGCQPIMKKMYGIKNPAIENEQSVKKAALRHDLDTTNIVTVRSDDFVRVLAKTSIPDAAIYDKHGKYIEYRQTDTSCNAGLFEFIPVLDPSAAYHQPDSASLRTELSRYRDLKGNPLNEPEAADFYILIYWTVWTGKLNENHVKIWEDQAFANSRSKIRVIKVNLDVQDYWPEQDKENIMQAMGK